MVKNYLAEFILEEKFSHCHINTQDVFKKIILDIVGYTVAGSQTDEAKLAKDFALELWQEGECSIFLSSEKINSVGAAFINATMTTALDLNSEHRMVKGQLNSIIFPAILAASEERKISGEEFLSALLVGYEIGIRADRIAHETRSNLQAICSAGMIGATAGVSRVIGLSEEALVNAIGITEHYSTYSPLMNSIEPVGEQEAISWASMAGVNSAMLAEKGFKRESKTFSEMNYFENQHVQELGRKYLVEQLLYKAHICNRFQSETSEALMLYGEVSEKEIKQKFLSLTEPVIGREWSGQLIETITHLEEVKNMREFTSLINKMILKQVV
ncbi:MmgE/PrpD family protein [Alkalihalobacillus deserti]|uniref:MmgE/PrpD family protein n=1 Tax=Alkalihalobacillus deserti TaxID=2879466 RepID=UPI001D137D32|nr:MmgE/PrpD family protein [Alkalihalobacillus deserti]